MSSLASSPGVLSSVCCNKPCCCHNADAREINCIDRQINYTCVPQTVVAQSIQNRLREALTPVHCRTRVCPWLRLLDCLLGGVPLKQVGSTRSRMQQALWHGERVMDSTEDAMHVTVRPALQQFWAQLVTSSTQSALIHILADAQLLMTDITHAGPAQAQCFRRCLPTPVQLL